MANAEGSIYRVENGVAVPYANLTTYAETDYDELTNRPQIENVTLTGNKTLGQLGLKPGGIFLGSSWSSYLTVAERFSVVNNLIEIMYMGALVQFYGRFSVNTAYSVERPGATVSLCQFKPNTLISPYTPFPSLTPSMYTPPFSLSEVIVVDTNGEKDKGTISVNIDSSGGLNLKFKDSSIGLAVDDVVHVKAVYLDQRYGGIS